MTTESPSGNRLHVPVTHGTSVSRLLQRTDGITLKEKKRKKRVILKVNTEKVI